MIRAGGRVISPIFWERGVSRSARAKQALNKLGASWKPVGRAWLEIRLTPCAALFYAPGTGSLRFEKGTIFSSRGLPLALEIVKAYQ